MASRMNFTRPIIKDFGMIPLSLKPISLAIQALYGMGEAINDYLDRHIAELKKSSSTTIAATGRVLEAAKLGFGLGYVSAITIIATGQLLLGNTLAAMGTVATGAMLANPVAMTCAALGAIYYGWDALSERERSAILDRLSAGLDIGIELIKSLIAFVLKTTKELLSSRQLAEFKEFIQTQASQFGKTLYDVTKAVGDLVKGTFEKAGDLAAQAAEMTSAAARKTADFASESADKVADSAAGAAKTMADKFRNTP